MLENLPSVLLPEVICRFGALNIRHNRKDYSLAADIIYGDSFLNLFLKSTEGTDTGLDALMTSRGWLGLRSQIGEIYLHYARHGQYPKKIILNEVEDVVSFVKKFDYLASDGSQRLFMLGMFFKLSLIEASKNESHINSNFSEVAENLDRILKFGSARSEAPDWLVFIVWNLISIMGADRAEELLQKTRGNFSLIKDVLSENEEKIFFEAVLKYGRAINDMNFFLYNKV